MSMADLVCDQVVAVITCVVGNRISCLWHDAEGTHCRQVDDLEEEIVEAGFSAVSN